MKKKELIEKLRENGYHNEWEITKTDHPYIWLRANSGYRDVIPSCIALTIKGRAFKNAAWYEHGSKYLYYNGIDERKKRIEETLDWIKKEFPDLEMVPSPFSRLAWVPKRDLEEALLYAKTVAKNSST